MHFALSRFFGRWEKADTVSDYPLWKIAISSATSWSWGLSVILGITFLWQYGLIPGIAWIVGNVLSLPALGLFRRYVPLSEKWTTFKPLFIVFIIVESYALLINLIAIKKALSGGAPLSKVSSLALMSADAALYTAIGIGVLFVLLINRYGFRGSVLSDTWQYAIQLGGAAIIAFLAFILSDGFTSGLTAFQPGGAEWLFLGFVGILTGAFTNAQQWERFIAVPARDAFRLGLLAGGFFGIYMLFVFFAGIFFASNIVLSVLLVVVILAIGSSTVDSAISAMQFIARRIGVAPQWGSALALILSLSLVFFPEKEISDIWNAMASFRWPIVVIGVAVTLLLQWRNSRKKELSASFPSHKHGNLE